MNTARLARVISRMEAEGLNQIIISSTASVYYLTGVWVEPMERMLCLYLNTDGEAVLYGNALFGLQPQPGLEVCIHTDNDAPTSALSRRVRPGVLGIDKFWPSKFLISLMDARKDLSPVLGSAPVDYARMYKDDDEIAAIRAASRINDGVVAEAISAVREGVREDEISALVERLFHEAGANHSSEGQLVCFGPNGADPHHAPNSTVIKDGDSVVLDLFIPIRRYWCDMTRTVFFRRADDEAVKVYEAVKNANLAAEAMIRPGVPMRDIDRAARAVIENAGYGPCFTHRLGHGCGLDCHEPPDNSSASEAVAMPGMVFSVEPGIYLPGRLGVRIEDLVLVTENGCEVLNAADKDLNIVS